MHTHTHTHTHIHIEGRGGAEGRMAEGGPPSALFHVSDLNLAHMDLPGAAPTKPLLSLYSSTKPLSKALSRLYQGSIKALSRLYQGS
jgi:hypothetical protein